jgi:hypothetical protein
MLPNHGASFSLYSHFALVDAWHLIPRAFFLHTLRGLVRHAVAAVDLHISIHKLLVYSHICTCMRAGSLGHTRVCMFMSFLGLTAYVHMHVCLYVHGKVVQTYKEEK